jgi:hypothetical protein
VSGDFMVKEIEYDKEVSIIHERSFPSTTRVIVDMREGTFTIKIGDE